LVGFLVVRERRGYEERDIRTHGLTKMKKEKGEQNKNVIGGLSRAILGMTGRES
jgi:hypothetical protein